MSEEKKEEKAVPEQKAAPKQETAPATPAAPAEAPKIEAAATAPATPAAPAEAPKAEAAAAPAAQAKPEEKKETPKKEKPANCAGCNKSIKRKRWYYRNGKFYCTKRCFTQAVKKAEKKAEAAPAA